MLVARNSLLSVMVSLWVLVFAFCMTSFSVPLLVSGEVPLSFDYLIYLKGFVEGDWSYAGLLGFIEWIFLGSLFLVGQNQRQEEPRGDEIWPFRNKYSFLFGLNWLPVGALLMSVLYISLEELKKAWQTLTPEIFSILKNTFFVSLWAMLFYTLIFWTQAYILRYAGVRRFHQFFLVFKPNFIGFYRVFYDPTFL